MIPVDTLSGCGVLIGLRHMSFGLRIISVPSGGKHIMQLSWWWFRNEYLPHILSSHSVPKGKKGKRLRNERGEHETAETKRSIYLHFHMCSTLGDAESLSQKTFNIWNMRAICFKRLFRLQPMGLSLHIKSVFHINWLVHGVIDKHQSEKGQNEEEGEKQVSVNEPCFVVILLHLCSHISIFILTHLLTKRERCRTVME